MKLVEVRCPGCGQVLCKTIEGAEVRCNRCRMWARVESKPKVEEKYDNSHENGPKRGEYAT